MKPRDTPRLSSNVPRRMANSRFLLVRMEVRDSPAWKELPANARLLLDALELVAMKAGFPRNGELVATYDHLVAVGLRRSSIRQAILEAEALGFVEIMRKGFLGPADVRVASVYRLTYVDGPQWSPLPTDEWRRHSSRAGARQAVAAVKKALQAERDHRLARRRVSVLHRGDD